MLFSWHKSLVFDRKLRKYIEHKQIIILFWELRYRTGLTWDGGCGHRMSAY